MKLCRRYSFKRKDSLSFDELCWDSHLHLACFKGHLPIVQYLIENGITPLHFASIRGRTDVIKYLVSKGGNKNVKDKNGKRPHDYYHNGEIREPIKWKNNFSIKRTNWKTNEKRNNNKKSMRYFLFDIWFDFVIVLNSSLWLWWKMQVMWLWVKASNCAQSITLIINFSYLMSKRKDKNT